MPRLFALDHNFPQPIVDFQVEAELVRIDRIDHRMPDLDDWKLLLALHHHPQPWDGLITTDSSILRQPRELAVLIQTRLTLVVALASGHDPVKASGLLFAYLAGICKRTEQLFLRRPRSYAGHSGTVRAPEQACLTKTRFRTGRDV